MIFLRYSNYGALAGIEFQKELEREAWKNGGHSQHAPAQRLADFVAGITSGTLPKSIIFSGSHFISPPQLVAQRRSEGDSGRASEQFGSLMKGYLTNDAVVLGIESRTSSPVRISRDEKTMQHIRISGLYPCGEGSGYAGGIVSSGRRWYACSRGCFTIHEMIRG